MKKRLPRLAAVLLLLLGQVTYGMIAVPGHVFADGTPTITEYPVPTSSSIPGQIVAGSDGALWFTETLGNKVGRITTTGVITEYSIPTSDSRPRGITAGPDGALWFIELFGKKIGRITTSGQFSEFPFPSTDRPNNTSQGLAFGSDGALWFTARSTVNGVDGYSIMRMTTLGQFTRYPVTPFGITTSIVDLKAGPDGALWFSENVQTSSTCTTKDSWIGRITTSGSITYNQLPSRCNAPAMMTLGPDGAWWLTESPGNDGSQYIGRFTQASGITDYLIPFANPVPGGITAGPDGAIWFTETGFGRIARLTTAGVFAEYNLPTTYSSPAGTVTGPDGALWFAEAGGNNIGKISLVPPDSTAPQVTGTPSPVPNAAGWNNSDVTVAWTAVDPDPSSGAPTTPPVVIANQEGTHTYTSAPSCDPAGNCATGSLAVSIDKSAPTISYSLSQAPNAAGWNNGDVTVMFNCADALSGVASCTAPVTVNEGANQTVQGTATDIAGNASTITVSLSVDKTAPTIGYTLSQLPNIFGWNNAGVTVAFDCSDALSGIASCSDPVTVGEGANQTVTGTATDAAGNTATVSLLLNIDATSPTISYGLLPVAPNAAGWYNSDVTASFQCIDFLAGVMTCSDPVTLTSDGANQTVTGWVTDYAFNTRSITTSAISIDKTAPTLSDVTLALDPIAVGQATTLSAHVGDAVSGISRAEYFVDSADPGLGNGTAMDVTNGVAAAPVGPYAGPGTHTFSVRTQDVAGNWSPVLSVNLDVYDPSAGYAAGHGFVTPGGATSSAGDTLPAVSGNNIKATLDFTVGYNSANSTAPTGNSEFSWGSGNCKRLPNACFVATTTSFASLVLPGDGWAIFKGFASLVLNGQSLGINYPVVIHAYDGGAAATDHYLLQIYAQNGDSNTDAPLYQASGDLTGGYVTLHPGVFLP